MAARSIRLTAPSASGPRSLALFAGRYLGETEFDILQSYVAERVRPLLEARAPGVVSGLGIGIDGTGDAARLVVQPGSAIGGDGRAIRLHAPLALDWPALRDVHKQRTRSPDAPDTPLEGWFYLTLRRVVAVREDSQDAKPCDRDQLDILRDSRVETLGSLGLQFIGAGPDLMDVPALRGANRVAARALEQFAFDTDSGAIPLALAKITNDRFDTVNGDPVLWMQPGRMISLPLTQQIGAARTDQKAAAAALAAHWEHHQPSLRSRLLGVPSFAGVVIASPTTVFDTPLSDVRPTVSPLTPFADAVLTRPSGATTLTEAAGFSRTDAFTLAGRPFALSQVFDTDQPLAMAFGVDYLPAAGRFPASAVSRIAGRPIGAGWLGPDLRFEPQNLQVDITAIPASQIDEMIARETMRGPVNLTEGSDARIRITVAVRDDAWRPDLMDLPETDSLLQDAVFARQREARNTWRDWARGWTALYGGLDTDAEDPVGTPTDETATIFAALRPPTPPAGAWPELTQDARADLSVNDPVAQPLTGAAYFQRIIDTRRDEATAENIALPRPYALGLPSAPDDLADETEAPDFTEDGLYARLFALEAEIAYIEAELDANQTLVADFDVYIRAQRQQVDSITTSFAALAGGVPGDGAGLQLARWLPYTVLNEITAPT